MNLLTVTVITKNEEKNLPRALASVAGLADEIVVVDSGSTDGTVALARRAGARVVERAFTDYSDQKNFAAAQAAHDWILNLDADEELSPALREELGRWKEQAPAAVAYAMPRKARYLGRWIEHSGWYPDPKVRLYRRDHARFAGRLHESVETAGAVGRLDADLYHHAFDTVEQHCAQVEAYAALAAQHAFSEGRRQWLLPMLLAPPWMFLRTYVLKRGFLDGAAGWAIACQISRSSWLKYAALGRLLRGQGAAPAARPVTRSDSR